MSITMRLIDGSAKTRALELAQDMGCSWDETHKTLDAPRGWTFFGTHGIVVMDGEWAGVLISLRHFQKKGFTPCREKNCCVCAERPRALRLVKG